MDQSKRVYIYDTTLRDGAQTQGVDFSAADKARIARELDRLGIDYIEGGWPGANPTDDAFFAAPPAFKRSRLTAFGMTRRSGRSADNDPGFNALLTTPARIVTMVGKSWDFQVTVALGIELDENLRMVSDSVAHARTRMEEVMFDAEHFFDGYKANPGYALAAVKAAHEAGARWVVLCDTNGGTLPHEMERIVGEVIAAGIPGSHIGVHCHNDSDTAVANSLAAVKAGARQIQGTLNGLGERCGNANLVSIIPALMLKMGFETGINPEDLRNLVSVSRALDEVLDRHPSRGQPYVGGSAFAHKGGLHVSAVAKDPKCYEHIDPSSVGNVRHIVMSDQAGRSNLVARMAEIGVDLDTVKKEALIGVVEQMQVGFDPRDVKDLVDLVKHLEHEGYAYDQAAASFELLVRRALGEVPEYFTLERYRVIDERRRNAKGDWITLSEATVKVEVAGKEYIEVGEGTGPVHAFDVALRKVLTTVYPELTALELKDYRVRITESTVGTAAKTRVTIESEDDQGHLWTTVGVHTNVLEASLEALQDSITFMLFRYRDKGVKAA
ncbi:citramalate synthase [Paramagnetospirillum marisnigri]|uniref:Citramalate synthase n=1 Tax=Paramagnetospirillum marisnigri TaxID=1285242 RepID=A0A178MRE2_9PROT|nr:citramalate synthase [Paramagnetospirillum marisnigri]OAN51408.1 citramalate synthase [Paramagnetospirillum marisnigri]